MRSTYAGAWIGPWHSRLVTARVDEELVRQLGEHASDGESVQLVCSEQLARLATSTSNRSTSAGHELPEGLDCGDVGQAGADERWLDRIREALGVLAPRLGTELSKACGRDKQL